MRKTIDLSKEEIKKVQDYQKSKKIKSFSGAMRDIVQNIGACQCETAEVPDDKFALLADAIVQLDSKVNELLKHTAPKSAGNV